MCFCILDPVGNFQLQSRGLRTGYSLQPLASKHLSYSKNSQAQFFTYTYQRFTNSGYNASGAAKRQSKSRVFQCTAFLWLLYCIDKKYDNTWAAAFIGVELSGRVVDQSARGNDLQ